MMLLAMTLLTQVGVGQVSISTLGSAVTENFNVMGASGTTYPTNWTGLRSAGSGTVGAALNLIVDNGNNSSGNVLNLGTTNAAERALGTLASGTTVPAFGVSYVNNTGSTIIQISLSGVMEQWRSGASTAVTEKVIFEYSTDATSLSLGTWTALTSMDLVEKLTSTTSAAAVDGNSSANQTSISGTISGLSIPASGKIWLRWTDSDNTLSDGAYAIDDFSLTAFASSSAPTITGITSGNQQLSVAFLAPSSDGGSSITTYKYSTNGGANWQTRASGTTGSPLVITTLSTDGTTALTNGLTYNVQIRAVNAVGNGAATGSTQGTPTAGTLPVSLLSFSGYKDGIRNQLRWVTSSEINNRGFQVERSSDGQSYQSIGFVNSLAIGGNSQTLLKYSFSDAQPAGVKQYYRLKQTDIDGRNTLSNILLIQGEKPTAFEIASVFPNPTRGQITMLLSAPTNETVNIRVMDLAGRILETRQVNVLTGNNSIPFDLSKQAKGQYLIQVGEKTVRVVSE